MNGIVIRIDPTKNFAYINSQNKDYFFHREDFDGHWNDLISDYFRYEGEIRVEFEPKTTEKGLRARNVKRLDWPNQ